MALVEVAVAEIIERDFGKKDREHARRLAQLLGKLDAFEADVWANPGKYLKMAADRVLETEILKRELYSAIQPTITMSPDPSDFEAMEIVNVDRAEYRRLKRAEAIIRARC